MITVNVQFVPDDPDPFEIPPSQAAVEASTSGVESEGLSNAMVSSIVAAVKTAIQSTNAAQNSSRSINLVTDAVQRDVQSLTNTPVGAVESSGSEILPSAPLFSSIGVPLGSRLSARLKNKIWAEEFVNFGSLLETSPNPDKFALSITARYDHKCSKRGGRHAATSCQSASHIPKPAGDRTIVTPSHNKQPASNAGKSIHT